MKESRVYNINFTLTAALCVVAVAFVWSRTPTVAPRWATRRAAPRYGGPAGPGGVPGPTGHPGEPGVFGRVIETLFNIVMRVPTGQLKTYVDILKEKLPAFSPGSYIEMERARYTQHRSTISVRVPLDKEQAFIDFAANMVPGVSITDVFTERRDRTEQHRDLSAELKEAEASLRRLEAFTKREQLSVENLLLIEEKISAKLTEKRRLEERLKEINTRVSTVSVTLELTEVAAPASVRLDVKELFAFVVRPAKDALWVVLQGLVLSLVAIPTLVVLSHAVAYAVKFTPLADLPNLPGENEIGAEE